MFQQFRLLQVKSTFGHSGSTSPSFCSTTFSLFSLKLQTVVFNLSHSRDQEGSLPSLQSIHVYAILLINTSWTNHGCRMQMRRINCRNNGSRMIQNSGQSPSSESIHSLGCGPPVYACTVLLWHRILKFLWGPGKYVCSAELHVTKLTNGC